MKSEDTGNKITNSATISRDAFVRAWSCGSLQEQGEMLFDLIGESVIVQIRILEECQRDQAKRLDSLEMESCQLKDGRNELKIEVEKQIAAVEKKWAYIAGGIGVIAVLVGPLAVIIMSILKG